MREPRFPLPELFGGGHQFVFPGFPAFCFGSDHVLPRASLAKDYKKFLWVLHYVLLRLLLQLENLLPFALRAAFQRSLGGRDSTDYYGSSVPSSDFQVLRHSGQASSHVHFQTGGIPV
jgi:hypothetical protein